MLKAAVRRSLDPPQVHAPGSWRPEWFWDWAAGFSAATRHRCATWLDDPAGAWLAPPDPRLSIFRTAPQRHLRLVRRTLHSLSRTAAQSDRVIWCLENRNGEGLDDVEAEAVFGDTLAIDAVQQIGRGEWTSKVLIAGRLRVDLVGVAVRLCGLRGFQWLAALGSLEAADCSLFRAGTVGLIFIDHETAQQIAERPHSILTRRFRSMMETRRSPLGLWVPSSRTSAALNDLAAEIAPLRRLAPGERVEHLAFEAHDQTWVTPRLRRAMAEQGINCMASHAATPHKTFARGAPYYRAGGYWPQPFDTRTPAVRCHDGLPSHLVRTIPALPFPALWNWRTRNQDLRLRQLLDAKPVAAFDQHLQRDPLLYQRYHEHHIFNWPAPAPSPRTTLLDMGPASPIGLFRLLAWAQRMSHARWRLVDGRTLASAAREEASARMPTDVAAALAHQRASHTYLGTAASDGRLRADHARFLEFLPEQLGHVLELGSGYGQFARAAASRAARYVCLELDPGVLKTIGRPMLTIAGDIHRLPFRAASFDTVVANNVLEHTYDPLECLVDVTRVLRSDGRLCAFIPLDAVNPAYELRAHYWKADEEGIRRVLSMAGLTPVRLEPLDIYRLGVAGSFPSCNGLVCQVEARKT